MASFENQGLDHVAIGVADVERSRRFYEQVVGLERAYEEWDVPVVMAAPKTGTGVAIFDKDVHPSPTPDDVEPPAVRILHIAFRLDRKGFDAARETLAGLGLKTHFSDHGLSHSIYFRDPDGHQVELTTYELERG
jgi:catechol 2,3-dioxygenase-like lactoylglutathione lyase family enzyme